MIKLISKLEANIFDNVLLKKGINVISEAAFNQLKKNKTFLNFFDAGFITHIVAEKIKEAKTEIREKPDFSKFSYEDLKKYVKENNIKVSSMKKTDLLAALNK